MPVEGVRNADIIIPHTDRERETITGGEILIVDNENTDIKGSVVLNDEEDPFMFLAGQP